MSLPRVVITHWTHPDVLAHYRTFSEPVAPSDRLVMDRAQTLAHAHTAQALVACMNDSVDDAFLSECPDLRVVAAVLKGYDNFDVGALARRKIWLTISPDLLTIPSAELTLGLILALTRNIRAADTAVRAQGFTGWRPQFYGLGLHGRTVGILGFGKVGRALAALIAPFGAQVVYTDRNPAGDQGDELRARAVDFTELLRASDIVVPLLPLTSLTRHLIDAAAIAQMERGAYLINASRGSVVDEVAVAHALRSGTLAGYAADVFEFEDWARADRPREIEPALLDANLNTVFTPHLGSAVDVVRRAMSLEAARAVEEALAGRRPRNAVEY